MPQTIAVIGSTGFLGPHIVAALLRADDKSNIICLNRSDDGKSRTISALKEIDDTAASHLFRLSFLVVNIGEPNFGLEETEARALASTVDEIVFNAWNSNWSLPLEAFKPFLQALQNTVDFCTLNTRRPRIVFVSSICAVGEWPRKNPNQPLIPETIIWNMEESAMAHGYGQSKCIAEQLLGRANKELEIPVAIVRAGQIGGPIMSNGPHPAWPIQGWIYSIISTSKRVGYWPAHVQPLDWIPVDALAEGMATITRNVTEDVVVYNMVHPQPAPWELLHRTLKSTFRFEPKEVSIPEWLYGLEPGTMKLYNFLQTMGNGREYDMAFENRQALQVLPQLAEINEAQLKDWFRGWQSTMDKVKAKL